MSETSQKRSLLCKEFGHKWRGSIDTGALTPFRECRRCGQSQPNPSHPKIKRAAEEAHEEWVEQ